MKLKLMGKLFDVEFVETDKQLDNKFQGRLDFNDLLITCNTSESPRDTMLHEVLHALNVYLHLGIETEDQITRAASGILMVMRENPKFTHWLLEDDRKRRYSW